MIAATSAWRKLSMQGQLLQGVPLSPGQSQANRSTPRGRRRVVLQDRDLAQMALIGASSVTTIPTVTVRRATPCGDTP
jgi:hypothetical protein